MRVKYGLQKYCILESIYIFLLVSLLGRKEILYMKNIQSAIGLIIIGLLVSNLFCGCSEEIKLDYKFEKQLVLNAILFAGQPVEIQIQSNFDLQCDIGE